MAYLIPQNVTPLDYECVTFFVPNDPLYVSQLITAYEHFTKWSSWERDDLKRGMIAAAAWKNAAELSWENGYMPNVQVTNNINVDSPASGCGCCSGGGSSTLNGTTFTVVIDENTNTGDIEVIEDGPYHESSGAPLPPEKYLEQYADWAAFNERKCKVANFYAGNIYRQMESIRFIFQDYVQYGTVSVLKALALAVADGPSPAFDVAAVAMLVVPPLTEWLLEIGGDTSEIGEFVLLMDKCQMAQIIYDAETKSSLGTEFGNYLVGLIDSSNMSPTAKKWLTAWVNYAIRNRFATYVFDNMSIIVPDFYVGECDCIGGPAGDLNFDFNSGTAEGWVFTKSPYGGSSNSGTVTAINPIEGSHSLFLDVLGNVSSSFFSGGSWEYQFPSNRTMQIGDKIVFDWDYVGTNRHLVRLKLFSGGSTILDVNFTDDLLLGPESGEAEYIADQVWVFDKIRVEHNESNPSGTFPAGEFRIDNVRLFGSTFI